MSDRNKSRLRRSFLPLKSLKFKFFIMNLLIVLSMFILFGSILLKSLYDSTSDQAFTTAGNSFSRITTFIDEEAATLRSTIDKVTLDNQTIGLLTNKNSDYAKVLPWNIDHVRIRDGVELSIYNSDIQSLRIVTSGPLATAYPSYQFIDLSDVDDTPWYEFAKSSLDSFFWDPPSDLSRNPEDDAQRMMFTRYLPYTYDTYPTYFVGYVSTSVFYNLMAVDDAIAYSSCFMVNDQGDVLTPAPTGTNPEVLDYIAASRSKSLNDIPFEKIEIDGQSYYLGVANIENTNLALVYVYEHYKMSKAILRTNFQRMLVIMGITMPFVLFLSLVSTISLTRRMDQLKRNMLKASEGDFDLKILSGTSNDEISMLNQHFNFMMTKISMLMDTQYKSGKRIKELEFISLQAQINPHFLYNTLDLIRWKALKNHDDESSNLIHALSDYYRFALSKGDELVTIDSELNHIGAYVQIQNMRFDDAINLNILVAADVRTFKIPKLTLQPIVENAIAHGILEKDEQQGTIAITSRLLDECCELYIHDDGVGIADEDLGNLLTEADFDHIIETGYGLYNINERIKLSFGDQYGIHIRSTLGKGTTIRIRLPLGSADSGEKETLNA